MNEDQQHDAYQEFGIKLEDIVNFLPDAILVIDNNGEVKLWNLEMEKLTGIKASQILGKGNYEYAIPFYNKRRPVLIDLVRETPEKIKQYYPDYILNGETVIAEAFVPELREEGAYLWAIAKPLYDENGNIVGAIESLRDITERKQAEKIIKKQKDELEAINSELSATIEILQETNTNYQETNQRLEEAQQDYLMANEKLRQSEEKYSTAFRLSPVILALSTVDEGKYVELSDYFYQASGYTKEEVIGHTAFDINIWANAEDRTRIIKKLTEEGRVINEEVQFRHKSGEIFIYYFSAEFLKIGDIPYLLSINVDITERKRAEEIIRKQKEDIEEVNKELHETILKKEETNKQLLQAQNDLVAANERLKQSEEKFSKAFHMGPIVITLSSLNEAKYVDVSNYFLKLTEYTREEAIGHSTLELNIFVDNEDRNRILKELNNNGIIKEQEIQFKSKSGKIYSMLYFGEIIEINNEPHIISVAIDVTERKKTEEQKDLLEKQLQQSQKMESVGRLAGGIAHDFNNLLTAIIGNNQLVMMDIDSNSSIYSNLNVVKNAAESAASLTKQLLAFSRKQIIEPKIIDLNKMIKNMQQMLVRLIGEDIRISISPKTTTAKIKADPSNMEQIIVNLAINARDAMPDGGELILETQEIILDDIYCLNHAYATPGDYIMLSVSDSGSGMTDEVKKNIFDPFFTTKSKGKGTGLGLATVYGTVKQNKGIIEVYSILKKGTTFKIYFPKVLEKSLDTPVKEISHQILEGTETILLVEDESLVRDYIITVLERLGYNVLEASNGEEAYLIEETYKQKIDLLFTDVILPDTNGKLLAEEFAVRRPNAKIVFTSGYTEDLIAKHGILDEGINFIGKPYSIYPLSAKIREIIEGD